MGKCIKFRNKVLTDVHGISCDSKSVKKRFIFCAVHGVKFNGEDYIQEAVENGARFILLEGNRYAVKNVDCVSYLYSPNLRKDMALMCSQLFPSSFEKMAAVTGTNGKTSTVHFLRQILSYSGKICASIGTLGVTISKRMYQDLCFSFDNWLTSPGPIQLHQILQKLKDKYSVDDIVMEASSHGIDQYRMFGNDFSVIAFTNFSQDHLDYHKSMEEYFATKLKLFSDFASKNSKCVLNIDSEKYDEIYKACGRKKIISYGFKSGDVHFESLEHNELGYSGIIFIGRKSYRFSLYIDSRYQLYNVLCAVAMAYAMKVPARNIAENLFRLVDVPGRMQRIQINSSASIYIDYAHTPDALKTALLDVRENCVGRVVVVLGCGGDRDKSKRSIMGEIAAEYADLVIVTDDNPRSEDPQKIRMEIIKGCKKATEIADRSKAIKFAISQMKAADCLLIAGKGHEDYQIIGNEKKYFSDLEEAKKALVEFGITDE